MSIPIAIVDDDEVDRYLVKRKIGKCEDFGELIEVDSGDDFLDAYFPEDATGAGPEQNPLLVLMDVNMPGRNGFETAAEIQRRVEQRAGPGGVVIMMFTSSNNHHDKQRAEELEIVKGYISKPLETDDIGYILSIYKAHCE